MKLKPMTKYCWTPKRYHLKIEWLGFHPWGYFHDQKQWCFALNTPSENKILDLHSLSETTSILDLSIWSLPQALVTKLTAWIFFSVRTSLVSSWSVRLHSCHRQWGLLNSTYDKVKHWWIFICKTHNYCTVLGLSPSLKVLNYTYQTLLTSTSFPGSCSFPP